MLQRACACFCGLPFGRTRLFGSPFCHFEPFAKRRKIHAFILWILRFLRKLSMTSPNDKAKRQANLAFGLAFAVPPVILSGVRKHKAKNPRFHFVDTSLTLSMTRLLLAATSVSAGCNAFKQRRLCKQIFNYDEIIIQFFTFVAEICKFFQTQPCDITFLCYNAFLFSVAHSSSG